MKKLVALTALAFLAGCGGGGGSSPSIPSAPGAPVPSPGTSPSVRPSGSPGPISTPTVPPPAPPTPTPTPSPMPTPPNATESVQQYVVAANGATLSLPSGTSVTIPANAIPADGIVQASTLTSTTAQPPSSAPLVKANLPVISIAFGKPQAATPAFRASAMMRRNGASSSNGKIRVVIPQGYYANAGQFTQPILAIYTSSGVVTIPGILQQIGNTIVAEFPSSVFLNAPVQGLQIFFGFLQAHAAGVFHEGLRYWDPTVGDWTTNPPPATIVHPILLLHGLASSVEDSYPPTMVQQLRANGAYDVVLGYDYNWTDLATNVAPRVAAALAPLNLSHLDVAGHSYGTLVAMATTPLLSSQADNVILYEGPLQGALTDEANYLGLVISLSMPPSLNFLYLPSSLVVSSDWYQQFVPGNGALSSIEQSFSSVNSPTRLIKVAGGTSLPFEAQAFQALTGSPLPECDGLITPDSAEDTGLLTPWLMRNGVPGGSFPMEFKDQSHVSLVSNGSVEAAVQNDIDFVLDNADPITGVFDQGQPTVFFKGVGANIGIASIYPTGNGVFGPEPASVPAPEMTFSPATAPAAVSYQTEGQNNAIDFDVVLSPTSSIGATPTGTVKLDMTDQTTHQTIAAYNTVDFWLLPACSSCNGYVGTNARSVTNLVRSALKRRPLVRGARGMRLIRPTVRG